MAENFINNYPVTVASSITNSATSLFVSAAASVDGGFRLLIESELLLVTSGGTTTTWTVTRGVEGTTSVAHVSGTAIYVVLTSASISNLRTQISGIGTYANLPTSGMQSGDRYKCTDSPYDFIFDGSAWQAFAFGLPVVVPPSSGWSWQNQGSAIVSSTHGYLDFFFPSIGSDSCSLYMRTIPSTPYTAIIGVYIDMAYQGGSTCGPMTLTVSDGTKFLHYGLFMFEQQGGGGGNPYHRILLWNTTTANAGAQTTYADVAGFGYFGRLMYLKLVDDGTNFTFYYSLNKQSWIQFDQRSRTAFLSTPTLVGVSSYHFTGCTAMLVSCEGI